MVVYEEYRNQIKEDAYRIIDPDLGNIDAFVFKVADQGYKKLNCSNWVPNAFEKIMDQITDEKVIILDFDGTQTLEFDVLKELIKYKLMVKHKVFFINFNVETNLNYSLLCNFFINS